MSSIAELFKTGNKKILNVYCTAGFPQLDSTIEVMKALQENGADLIELGMPYSDPLADGPVIQQSGAVALDNGMTIEKLLEQLQDLKKEVHVPVILMGYMNPVLQYGFEPFCKAVAAAGVAGLILPDLPPHEFEATYGNIIHQYGLDFIFLVTPETSEERVRQLDALSSGFLYAVSSSSTTGSEKDFAAVEKYLERLQRYQLKNPILVGFGIKDHSSFTAASKHAAGAIIGSAYIQALQATEGISAATAAFLQSVLQPS